MHLDPIVQLALDCPLDLQRSQFFTVKHKVAVHVDPASACLNLGLVVIPFLYLSDPVGDIHSIDRLNEMDALTGALRGFVIAFTLGQRDVSLPEHAEYIAHAFNQRAPFSGGLDIFNELHQRRKGLQLADGVEHRGLKLDEAGLKEVNCQGQQEAHGQNDIGFPLHVQPHLEQLRQSGGHEKLHKQVHRHTMIPLLRLRKWVELINHNESIVCFKPHEIK